jgi:hypothetical protein
MTQPKGSQQLVIGWLPGVASSCGDGLFCDTLRNGSRRYPRNSLDTRVRNHT